MHSQLARFLVQTVNSQIPTKLNVVSSFSHPFIIIIIIIIIITTSYIISVYGEQLLNRS